MPLSGSTLEKNKGKFVFVPSNSKPNTMYRVYINHKAELACSCPGFVFRNKCNHLKKGGELLYEEISLHNHR